jgi:enoyl-CoA hydratase/carnithine racemase
MSEYEDILYEVDDPVATITLNRPATLNALTHAMLAEIRHAVDRAAADARVVGIVITGAGRGFCSGLDAEVLRATTEGSAPATSDRRSPDELPGLFSWLTRVPKPVICALNGVAAGGGTVLALMSDVRFASTDAAVTTVFLKRGLIAEHGMSWVLPRLVGSGRALDLLWTSDKIDGDRAHEIGLVEYLTAPEELLDQARDYVRRLAEVASPAAMAESKWLVWRHLGEAFAPALEEVEEAQTRFVGLPDAVEGAKALLERRAPKFERLGD